MLLVAVAAGAIAAALLAVLQPALPTRLPPVLVWVAAAAGAIAVGLADTAPTGWEPFDLLLRASFGAIVPIAAARAGTVATAWLGIVATATLLVADAPGAAVAGVAAGALLALAAAAVTTPAALAIAVAAAVGPLAHADWPLATGASAAAVAVGTAPLLLVGLARTRSPLRGRIVLATAVVVVLLGLGAVAGLVAALSARTDIDRAVDLATDGLDRLGDDDERARSDLLDAAGAFESAQDTLTTWWARPALLVPAVAQQTRAVSTMASAGADLARTAADASAEADVDSIRPVDGRVDLEALAALAEPLDRSVSALRQADRRLVEVESPVLLGPIAERLTDLRSEVELALESADLAAHAVEVAPGLLGADGPRRYFLAFQNPSEQRGNGGFMGNWAEIVADGGELTLARTGRSRDLFSVAPPFSERPIDGEDEALAVWGDQVADWRSINFSPDHPTVSRLISQLYPKSGGAEVDGVIAMTPVALAGFLELTGPIQAPGYEEPLTPDNVARILLHEQYLTFPQERGDDREEFLSDVVETVFDQLTSGEIPGPRVIARELGSAVHGQHLQLWSSHDREQSLFQRLDVTGSAERDRTDSFGVVTQNGGGNKIDWFLHREIVHNVEWDPATGAVEGTITVRLRNEAPDAGLPSSIIGWGGDPGDGSNPIADGENVMLVTLYSTFPIEQVTIDGGVVDVTSRDELGHRSVQVGVLVPSRSVREVVASVRGVAAPSATYTVRPLRQATINPDQVTSTVRVADGWEVDDVVGGEASADGKVVLTSTNADPTRAMSVTVVPTGDELTLLDRLRGTGRTGRTRN